MQKESYKEYTKKHAKKSPLLKDCLWAFFSGGAICVLGKLFYELYIMLGASAEIGRILVPVTLIFLACLFTGIGWFDNFAKYAGAGTLVPITGFANATIAPTMDAKSEGFILGIGAKMFTISGAVILYGILASAIYGIIYWIVKVI